MGHAGAFGRDTVRVRERLTGRSGTGQIEHEPGRDPGVQHVVDGGVDILELADVVDDAGAAGTVQFEHLGEVEAREISRSVPAISAST